MRKLYHHGDIVTMDKNRNTCEAILIEDDHIIAVGTNKEILALEQEEDEVINLQGKTMLPGFIDGHSHFVAVANALTQCDLSDTLSFADIVKKMKTFIKEHDVQPGEWVTGNAYDHNFLMEKQHPDKRLLDKISSVHPIVIVHASSHMGVANSLALKIMNINEHTADPEGGKYGRMGSIKEPDGYMEENAFISFQNAKPMMDIESLMKLIVKAQDIYASYGITTVQDGMVAKPLFQLLQYAAAQNLLKLDIIGYIDLNSSREVVKENPSYVQDYVHHFKIGGYKIFLDGSPQGRTAWMSIPYAGSEDGYCGYPALKDERLHELITEALEDHMQLLAHCNGDAAAEQFITQFESVKKAHPDWDTCHPVMIHAQLVRKDQLERMPSIHMTPSFFIAHTYFWGDIHIENFGMERASKISPAKDAEDLGLRYTFHQDSPVLPPDIMRSIWCAVNRKTRTGVSIGQEETVSVYEALKANTVNAADQYMESDKKGSLKAGMLADLVILDQNPLKVDKDAIKDIKVLETIKEGITVYRLF